MVSAHTTHYYTGIDSALNVSYLLGKSCIDNTRFTVYILPSGLPLWGLQQPEVETVLGLSPCYARLHHVRHVHDGCAKAACGSILRQQAG